MNDFFQPRRAVLAAAIAVALTACGGGSHDSAPPVTPPPPSAALDGVVVDGYLSGATVFLDANNNGILDDGEDKTTTDAKGAFHLQTKSTAAALAGAHLVAVGGTDTSTNTPFGHAMMAVVSDPAQAVQPISPLSTVVSSMVASGATASTAAGQLAQVLGLASSGDLNADPLSKVVTSPTLLQKMVALQQAMQVLAASDQAPTETTTGPAMTRAATAIGAVIAQQSAGMTGQSALPSVGSLVSGAVANQAKAFKNAAAVQASGQLATGVANVTEATVAAAVSQLLQANPGASGTALSSAIASTVDPRLTTLAPLQAAAQTAAKKATGTAPVTLGSVASASNVSGPLRALVAATERLASVPNASATQSQALAALGAAVARLSSTSAVALEGGTIMAPVSYDGGTGSGQFTVDAKTAHFVRITNFGVGDTLVISGAGSNPLIVANVGADVVLTINANGTVTQVTLVGVTTPSALIGSLAAFNALGLGQVKVQ